TITKLSEDCPEVILLLRRAAQSRQGLRPPSPAFPSSWRVTELLPAPPSDPVVASAEAISRHPIPFPDPLP
ncbi:hypothetical protein LINPERHAP1_LOCUS34346, partial [Linum perenne]